MLLTGDLGFTVFEEFRDTLPAQFINMGVAEQNMMGVAAGLALTGKIVFAYSIPTFSTMRPFEQIRNDIASHNASVIIVGTGAGLSYSKAQLTHFAVEDIALMRTIPNMTILCPADPTEVVWATQTLIARRKPAYLRLGMKGEPTLYKEKPQLTFGKVSVLRNGSDCTILSTGNIVYNSLLAADILAKKGIRAGVVSVHTIKPIDKPFLLALAQKTPLIITVEEHNLIGGFGSAVAEVIAGSSGKAKLLSLGVKDVFIRAVGSHAYLRTVVGLSPEAIARKIYKAFKIK